MKLWTMGLAAILAMCFAGSAEAKSFSIPTDKPLATLQVPDDWAADTRDAEGIAVTSEDDAVSIMAGSVPIAQADEIVKILLDASAIKKNFKPDESTKKVAAAETDLDGAHAKVSSLSYAGEDKGGAASFKVTTYVFDKRPDQIFVLGLFVGSGVNKGDSDAAAAIMQSIHFTP